MAKSRHGHRREEQDVLWKQHEETLSEIFFRPKDFIQRESEEYKDFWRFLERYEAFRKRTQSARNEKTCSSSSKTSQLGVPMTYDKRYKINVSILTSDVIEEQRSKHSRERRSRSTHGSLNSKHVAEFRSILLYYIDFCQKQKFNKIVKLKKDQSNLPISHFREQIVEAVKLHQVVIIAGDTGCGKSTQVPQYLLNAGFTQIACTQPRRIACISLAKRVGYETLKEYGSEVAYQIRFEANKTKATRILFLTEGLLLRQLSSDPDLSQYNVIIVDEVHERHLHGDFLLGMLRYLIEGRADLKIVLMSATININLFAGYFEGAPVIQVPGRLYPIQVQYHPPSVEKEKPTSRAERLDPSPYLRIMQLIDKKYPPTERGDLLMFLSGMVEIAAVVDAAKDYAQKTQRWIILPLHSSLSVEEQDKVFDIAPDGVRKCVVSTNIAETSITIDGIRFIVDSGKVKEMNFDPQEKMQRLKEFWISQASAEQRKGRAGRTGPGVCFRLYSENDYHAFSQYATPEIQRTSLDTTILQMVALGINDVRAFAFIEPPPPSSIENSMYFLKQQGALTEEECLTPVGLMLSRLPVDVVIGKMLLMGSVFHLTDPVMVIAAGLSVQSPFTRRLDHDPDVTSRREELESDHGDPFTLLNAYDEWIKIKGREGYQSRKWCKRRGLEQQRFYEMTKLKNQFEDLLHDHGLVEREEKDESDEDEIEKEKFKRRQLKRMKQDHHKSTRRRKLLKLDEDENEADEIEAGNDIRDLEFKLTHDMDKLQEDSSARRNFTLRDINLLKIILCSGLYPNLAVPDETNSFKRDSEQTFHTKSKQYLLLHPTSVFATQPDILQTQEVRDFHQSHAQTRDIFSGSHQLLAYVSLLETNKPYLVNVMRVPGLQTLLLFARSLDTNTDLTRVIADAWLEVRFADVTSAQKGLSAVLQLRGTWARLLELKLDRKSRMINTDGLRAGERNRCRDLERLLALKLSEFLDSDIRYSITRLLSSEEKHLYIGPDNPRNMHGHLNVALPLKGSSTSLNIHPIKGGIQINEYLTYNCLQDEIMAEASSDAAQFIQKHWKCEKCGVKMVVTVLERLQHENRCHGNNESDVDFTLNATDAVRTAAESSSNLSSVEHLKKCYFCVECSKEYSFTSTEILKHRRTHR